MKNFPHAFRVRGGFVQGQLVVTVDHGTVNGYEPRVGGRRISGMDASGKMSVGGPPVISGPMKFDVYGRLYVCLRVKVNEETGKMDAPTSEDNLTVVISRSLRYGSEDNAGLARPVYWNHPLATFTDSKAMGQVVHFNLLHFTAQPANPMGGPVARPWHHYFCAA